MHPDVSNPSEVLLVDSAPYFWIAYRKACIPRNCRLGSFFNYSRRWLTENFISPSISSPTEFELRRFPLELCLSDGSRQSRRRKRYSRLWAQARRISLNTRRPKCPVPQKRSSSLLQKWNWGRYLAHQPYERPGCPTNSRSPLHHGLPRSSVLSLTRGGI